METKKLHVNLNEEFKNILKEQANKLGFHQNMYLSHIIIMQEELNDSIENISISKDGLKRVDFEISPVIKELLDNQTKKNNMLRTDYICNLLLLQEEKINKILSKILE